MIAYFLGMNETGPSTSAVNYMPFESSQAGAWSTAETQISQVIPHALTMDQLNIHLVTAPGTGKSYAFVVMVNGSPSALTCTVSDTNTTASDNSHSLSLNAGDVISLRCTPSGTPTAAGTTSWNARQSASGQFACLCGSTSSGSSATYVAPQAMQAPNATEANIEAPCPIAGTIKNLTVKLDTAPGGSGGTNGRTVMFRKNVADTTLTVTISDTNTTGSDTTHTVTVAAGDLLAQHLTLVGSPANSRVSASYTFVPTTDGDACWMHSQGVQASTTATNYDGLTGNCGALTTTESTAQMYAPPVTMKSLYGRSDASVGASPRSSTWTVRKNGSATALTIADTTTSAVTLNITGQTVAVAAGDLLSFEIKPSATAPSLIRVAGGIYYVDAGVSSTPISGTDADGTFTEAQSLVAAEPDTDTTPTITEAIVQKVVGIVPTDSATITDNASSTSSTQKVYPVADISRGAWLAEPGDGTTSLFAGIDESVVNPSDYVQSSLSPLSADIYRLRLGPLQAPSRPRLDGVFHFRVNHSVDTVGGDTIQLTVKLFAANGTTQLKSWAPITLDVETTTDLTLTGAEADTIPDPDFNTGLILQFEALKL